MRVKCVSPYTSNFGTFKVGQIIDVSDYMGGVLLRDSPGSFVEIRPNPQEERAPEAEQVGAMSEETATGIVAPDRRQRRGRSRRIR